MRHIRPGSLWLSHNGSHLGWVLEVLKATGQVVYVCPRRGPCGRRKNPHYMNRATFLSDYVEIGSKRKRAKG